MNCPPASTFEDNEMGKNEFSWSGLTTAMHACAMEIKLKVNRNGGRLIALKGLIHIQWCSHSTQYTKNQEFLTTTEMIIDWF